MSIFARFVCKPPDLFCAGISRFAFAQFDSHFEVALLFEADEFIDSRERRRIVRRGKLCAHAERIYLRAASNQVCNAMFIQVAACEYLSVIHSSLIEYLSDSDAQFEQVAAIEAHSGNGRAEIT